MTPQPIRTVLIAGGAGFLGSHLCDHHHDRGWNVICVDDLSTGDLDNIRHLLDSPRFRFVRHDIREPLDLQADRVFNMACPASPPKYQADPIGTMFTNVSGTANLLEVARRSGARFLQASTSEIYGQPEVHPQPEGYFGNVSTLGPRACYDEGKRAAEALCMDYARVHGVNVRIARIFNTYGPRMAGDDGRVVSTFVSHALAGKDITVFGDGSQTRSFCYVDDLVRGLVALSESDVTVPVNLGSQDERTVLELAHEVLAEVSFSRSRLSFLPLPKDDPKIRRPDTARARELLGWQPRVSLSDGLRRTIAWFQQDQLGVRKAS